jgi:arylsulfatase A-like enzyme|uniref:sulfatase-like hydrolase/transferase n=1 Tax=Cephaloticoccus sp. TaxID=1985742 RepID=UPI00404AFC56
MTQLTKRPPNILMVVADDHRHDCLHGDRINGPATPTLDALAKRGTKFCGARIMGGDTGAVCVPSRAALQTGCGSRRALANPLSDIVSERHRINADRTLLGEAFKAAGYRTHAVGKWHNDPASLNRGFESGSALFLGGMSQHENPPLHEYDSRGEYPATNAVNTPGFSTELFADASIKFIEESNHGTAPFLLYCAFTSPHDPRTPPNDFRQRYRDQDIKLPENFMRSHPFDNGELDGRDEQLALLPRDPDVTRRHRGDYYGMIEHHDHHFGRMVLALERTGQLENTVIVYVSDHGLALGSHGLMGKQNLYEHSVRVPLIMSGPRIPTGRIVADDVYSFRLFATLCDLANVPTPVSVEEPGLVPLWEEEEDVAHAPQYHFTHYCDFQRAVKDQRWKLITYQVNGTVREQLFDLIKDPHELNDLSGHPAFAAHQLRLAEVLENWEIAVSL